MKKYLIGVAVAVAVAGAVGLGLSAGDDDESTTAQATSTTIAVVTPDVASADVATITGDDTTDDDALGTQGEEDVASTEIQPEVEEPVTIVAREVDSEAVLGDLRSFVAARAADIADAVAALDARRGEGVDVGAEIAGLVDDVTIFGESVITGVAITPETLEVVPDLRERHEALINGVDELHSMLSALDPDGSDEAWSEGFVAIIETLDTLADSLN